MVARSMSMALLSMVGCAAPKTAIEECRPPGCFADAPGPKRSGWDDEDLRKRAAFDLHCPAEKIELSKLAFRTGGVQGCGRQATYIEVCPTLLPCSWVLNADVHTIPVAPASQDVGPSPTSPRP
jgi:hypothetical protein